MTKSFSALIVLRQVVNQALAPNVELRVWGADLATLTIRAENPSSTRMGVYAHAHRYGGCTTPSHNWPTEAIKNKSTINSERFT